MCKKLYFLISFVLVLSLAYTGYGDTTPPDPDPMFFDIDPYARPQGSIAMKATTATDINDPPVEYYFECTTDGDANSEWQEDPCYIVYNLSPATAYTFRVKARDNVNNETDWSDPCSATTPLIMLDFDDPCDPNTEHSFTGFTVAQSGSTVSDIIIDLGDNIYSLRRSDPNGMWYPEQPDPNAYYWRRCYEDIYRDFIFAVPPSGVTITLWELGANRECDITIYAFDDEVDRTRIANWTANDANLLTTEFVGGSSNWPGYARIPGVYYPGDGDEEMYAFTGTATADANFGRIILESTVDPCSKEGDVFAYVNALVVTVYGDYVPVKYAHRPVPVVGQEDVPIDGDVSWTPAGAFTPTHDIYFDTNETAVTNATRDVNLGVLVSKDHTTTTYDWDAYLKMGETYYWRVDEVNDPLDPNSPYKGEVWSFTARDHLVAENFNQYGDGDDLRDVWVEVWPAEVDLIKTAPVRDGSSMKYRYRNNNSPYYATATADVATAPPDGLGMDPDWLSAGAKALSLWFYGDPCNPVDEQMYIDLTDGDGNTWTVPYGDMNDVLKAERTADNKPIFKEWNIDLTVAPSYLNLDNMKSITIRFGEPGDTSGSDGTVYFEDIKLYPSRCVLAKRSAALARVDFYPGGETPGDCVVDYQEIGVLGDAWLRGDEVIPTKNPNDVNLVLYYQFDEGDGNKIYPHPSGRLNDPCIWSGTFWNSAADPPSNLGTKFSSDHVPNIGGTGCVYMDGSAGARISCGKFGHAALGIHPDDANAMTLSIWAKWLGPKYHMGSYFVNKGQGLLGKRGGWAENKMIWTFWYNGGTGGSFGLGHFSSGDDATPDLYSPGNIVTAFIGEWVHLAATFPHPSGDPNDANDYARLFFNGQNVSSGPWRLSHGPDPDIFLTIGQTKDQNAWPDSPTSFYGYLDEVRIYDRALDPCEVAYLADTIDPNDGVLMVPIPSSAEVYEEEPSGSRYINFRDFALISDVWLQKEYWP